MGVPGQAAGHPIQDQHLVHALSGRGRFHNKPDATAACEALNGAALLGSEALMVRYATNTRADDMSDDDDDNNDDGDSDVHGSDGMEDDEFDADDFI